MTVVCTKINLGWKGLKIVLGPRKTWKVEYDTFGEHFEFKNLNNTLEHCRKEVVGWWIDAG